MGMGIFASPKHDGFRSYLKSFFLGQSALTRSVTIQLGTKIDQYDQWLVSESNCFLLQENDPLKNDSRDILIYLLSFKRVSLNWENSGPASGGKMGFLPSRHLLQTATPTPSLSISASGTLIIFLRDQGHPMCRLAKTPQRIPHKKNIHTTKKNLTCLWFIWFGNLFTHLCFFLAYIPEV